RRHTRFSRDWSSDVCSSDLHHSSLTRIRQQWGEERFRKSSKRTVEACFEAKIATAEVVHIDASLIRANVSWESFVERHAQRKREIGRASCRERRKMSVVAGS